MAQTKRKIHISLTEELITLADKILTPEGFIEPAKGSYSSLFNMLLQQYIEKYFGMPIFDVVSFFRENPDLEIREAQEIINNNKRDNNDGTDY